MEEEILNELFLILALALNVSQSHTYCWHQMDCERFNCADFTKDLVLQLRENNFTAYPMCGSLHAGILHAWVN